MPTPRATSAAASVTGLPTSRTIRSVTSPAAPASASAAATRAVERSRAGAAAQAAAGVVVGPGHHPREPAGLLVHQEAALLGVVVLLVGLDAPALQPARSAPSAAPWRSDPVLRREPPGLDRLLQGLVVGLGLVGVQAGEARERPVGGVALAEVAGQQGGAGGAGVALGEQGAADAGVVQQGGAVHAVHGDRALHVAELADVVVAAGHPGPAQRGGANGLQG